MGKVATKAAPVNMFDSIAKKAAPTKKTTKIAASVTDAIKSAVDQFISLNGQIDAISATLAQHKDDIITHVRKQQDELGYKGEYNKSFTVAGNVGELTYTTKDQFSVPKEDAEQDALRELLGEKFTECFQTVRTITIKADIQSNEAFMKKLMEAVRASGKEFGDIFTVTDKLVATSGLDANQYVHVPSSKLEMFRALAKQYSPTLK